MDGEMDVEYAQFVHNLLQRWFIATCFAHIDAIYIYSALESFHLSLDYFRQAHAQQNQDKNTSEDADLYGHPFGFNV